MLDSGHRIQDSGAGTGAEGFTLLELLIAIAVMLILAAIAIPRIMRVRDSAHEVAIRTELRTLGQELSVHKMDCGGYPESLDALNPSPQEGCPKGSVGASDPAIISGYRMEYKATNPDEDGRHRGYALTAEPMNTPADGVQFYFMNQTGIIRVRRGAAATASDPALVP